tara:strand:- start:595 stop:909 length:315 start_codon:yes stop_codon:yes gene_type:complete
MPEWEYKTLTFDHIHEEVKKYAEKSFPMPTLVYVSSAHSRLQERERVIAAKNSFIEHEIPKRIQQEIEHLISLDDSYPDVPDIRGYEFDSEKDGKYTFKKKLTE